MARIVQELWAKNKMATAPTHRFSPDLAPSGFFLFLKMNIKLKG
jgi:hypothetical protein